MPKIRLKSPKDPYMEYLQLSQYGARSYGANDRLLKRMAEDVTINSSWYQINQ